MLPDHVILANSTYGYRDPNAAEVKKLLATVGSTEEHDNDADDQEVSTDQKQPRQDPSQSGDDHPNHTPHMKRRRATSTVQPVDKDPQRRRRKRTVIEYRGASSDVPDQSYLHGMNSTDDRIGANLAKSNPVLSYRTLEHLKNQYATVFDDLGISQSPKGTGAAVYNPPHGVREFSHSKSSQHPTQYSPLQPNNDVSFSIYDLDLNLQPGDKLINGIPGWDIAAPFQSKEISHTDMPLQNDRMDEFAEILLEHGKTYIFICLETAKATKCIVSADGDVGSETLSLQSLDQHIHLLEGERPLWKGKAVLGSDTDQKPEHEAESDYTELLLPVDMQYIIVCIEDRRFDKAVTVEGLETPWDQIEYRQLVDDVEKLEGHPIETHKAHLTRPPVEDHDILSGHQSLATLQQDQLGGSYIPYRFEHQAQDMTDQANGSDGPLETAGSPLLPYYNSKLGADTNLTDSENVDDGSFLDAPFNTEVGHDDLIEEIQQIPDDLLKDF